MSIVSVVGNPRPRSRTRLVAETLAGAIADELGLGQPHTIDLAELGPAVLDPADERVKAATEQVLAADVLMLASPTYKATYSGLLKAFLDRIGGGALDGALAVPVLLGGAPNHQLAVEVHFTPLLRELGARVPAGGLFVLESELDTFEATAAAWAKRHAPFLGAFARAMADGAGARAS